MRNASLCYYIATTILQNTIELNVYGILEFQVHNVWMNNLNKSWDAL